MLRQFSITAGNLLLGCGTGIVGLFPDGELYLPKYLQLPEDDIPTMASLIPGYEYDIFISYRHKDNKYDGWVSEFVINLRKELDATLKEDISIYFDENPHDGLLETHNVDKSLQSKLKCLICIPILSQTYCDPKSFAWNNEFLVFRDMAATDAHGPDIKLSNGNVVSRILHVRIHNLDASDRALFEKEIGQALRPVDFIFRSAGVNRPLRANEDHPHDNLNKTYYRDQINKVANVVKGIIFSISRRPNDKANAADLLPLRKDPPLIQKVNSGSDYFLNEIAPEPAGTDPHGKNAEWRRRMAMPLLFSVLVLTIVSAWGWLRPGPEICALLPTYSTIPVESPYGDIELNPYFAMSPDGRTIAYSQAGKGIVLKTLSSFSEKLLAGTERARNIAFSPDGKSLAYVKGGGIHKIGITGAPISLISNVSGSAGMSWAVDGNIYFSGGQSSAGIWRVTAAGDGKPEEVTSVYDSLGENAHTWPQLLPDKNTLLFAVMGASDNHEDSRVVIENIKTRERKVLVEKRIFGRYLSNGNLIYATNDGSVFTAPFDLKDLEIRGQAVTILSGVTTGSGGAVFLTVSENGNMVFLPRNNRPLYVLDLMDRAGQLISDSNLVSGYLSGTLGLGWADMKLSPSGEELTMTGRSYGKQDIWVPQIKTGNAERLTFDIAQDERPVWSPEGNKIAYASTQTGTSYPKKLLLFFRRT